MYERAIKCIIHYETSDKPERFLKAYKDAVGIWTIGIGSTMINGRPVKEGDVITLEQAYELMVDHINTEIIPYLVNIKTTSQQLEAFISLIYNIGVNGFLNSTVLKYHKQNKGPEDMIKAFGMWNKAKGKILPGLVRRRRTEAILYNTGELHY